MCEHHHEHEHEHDHEHHHDSAKSFALKIGISLMFLAAAVGLKEPAGLKLILFAAAYLPAGGSVIRQAWRHLLKGKLFDENFLMAAATIGAFAIGEYPEAVMVMVLYQIGEYLQHRAVEKSRRSIAELMDIRPDYAMVEHNGKLIKKAPGEIAVGDIIVVKSGEKIPLDGVVVEGRAVLDTAALTGEAAPREVSRGSEALSGCINTDGLLKIKVGKLFGESTVSKILQLVEHADAKKAKTENFITRFARYYTPAVVGGALLLAVLPPLLLDGALFTVWLERALTFLVISCPCALVISVPLSFFAGIGGASRRGILIKGSNYLEVLAHTGTAVFDKTGTLTVGKFAVSEILPLPGYHRNEILAAAAAAEYYSNHPIAISLKDAYGQEIDVSRLADIKESAGNGVKANIDGHEVLVGNDKLLRRHHIPFVPRDGNGTIVHAAKDGKYMGCIIIADQIKKDAEKAVAHLKKAGITTVMLSGDSCRSAETVGSALGINQIYAELLPEQKVAVLETLISQKPAGKSVIFAGDGINDAPVLTCADAGIAMGGLGSDAAIEAADIVIMDDRPSQIPVAVQIAGKTMRIVKQNIVFAIGVKGAFLILGAAGMMTMWGAVFADVGVTVLAVFNALRALRI